MSNLKSYSFKLLLLSFLITAYTGCANVASVLNLDADLDLNVAARADMNPDDKEIASPLVLRLYELKDKNKFEKMSFYDIYQNDVKLLGKNLIDKHVFEPLVPDSKFNKKIVLDKNTRYIGLFAEFTQYRNAEFIGVIKIDQHFDKTVDVVLTSNLLKIESAPRKNTFEEDTGNSSEQDLKKANKVLEQIPG